jgi:hypothetical protein
MAVFGLCSPTWKSPPMMSRSTPGQDLASHAFSMAAYIAFKVP